MIGVVESVIDKGYSAGAKHHFMITVVYQRDDGAETTIELEKVVSTPPPPSPGDKATVWYDPAGPKVVMELGVPRSSTSAADADIADMLDAAGVTDGVITADSLAVAAFQSSEPEDSVPDGYGAGSGTGTSPLVASLERLAALHRDGSLNEFEYTLAKQRLLNDA